MTTDSRFAGVRAALERNLETGAELGASIAVEIDGELVLDVWGGHRDVARTLAWESDTIATVFSITKIASVLAVLMLAGDGELDLDAPVAAYWPEFAAQGKGQVLVRHVLAHASGLSGFDAPIRLDDLYDARAAAARLAAQAPWWEPGTASGYHLLTHGFLLGELVRRRTGKSLTAFVADRIAGPLGADFQIGAAPGDRHRIAELVEPPAIDVEGLDHDGIAYRTFTGPPLSAAAVGTPGWQSAEIGAANGHGNARSVARLLSALVGDERVHRPQTEGVDLVNGLYVRWGLGLALSDRRTVPWIPEGRVAYWGGWGGSMAIVDSDRRMTVAYVMNRMGSDILGSDRAEQYVTEIYRAVAQIGSNM
jgi:CubicO group peptidase (beta-lactamase class C family)